MTANHRALDKSDIKLIETVKMTPSLYDPRNPSFRLAYRKEQDWDDVGNFIGLSATDARRRWTCLRDRYSRELKQLRLHPEKGEYGKNEFFRLMDFLRKFVRKRRERRRHQVYKYESSWDGSLEVDHPTAYESQSDMKTDSYEADDDNVDENIEEDEQANYDKVETVVAEEFPEYVEDASETETEYIEHPPTTNEASESKADAPILIPQQNEVTTYTMTSTNHLPQQHQLEQGTHEELYHDEEHQQQLQHQQQAQPLPTTTHTQTPPHLYRQSQATPDTLTETEDDYFCKSMAAYLRQLSRRHKIKAKVEMFQILEKYIEMEENSTPSSKVKKS